MPYTEMMEFVDGNLNPVITVTCFLSICGCALIIFTYFSYKNIQTPSRYIIMCISVADLFTALGSLFAALYGEPGKRNTGCVIQSFVSSASIMSSFLWTTVLAVYLYFALVKERQEVIERMTFIHLHIVCTMLPLVTNIVALSMGKLGSNSDLVSSGWCWIKYNSSDTTIKHQDDAILWMFLDSKAFEILSYVVIFALYITIKLHIKHKVTNYDMTASGTRLTEGVIAAARSLDRKVLLIPIVLIVLKVWGTIRFFIFIAVANKSLSYSTGLSHLDKVLLTLQAIGDNLIGFTNCVLFCFFSPKIMRNLRSTLQNISAGRYCWCRRKSSSRVTEKSRLFAKTPNPRVGD